MLTRNQDAGPAARTEAAMHTDAPATMVDIAIAYEVALATTEGDRVAAAILAHGAVLAEALRERRDD